MSDNMNDTDYQVVLNDEEQYSIWPAYRALPAGWRAAGTGPASRQACQDYIESHWVDMRPRGLRDDAARQ